MREKYISPVSVNAIMPKLREIETDGRLTHRQHSVNKGQI